MLSSEAAHENAEAEVLTKIPRVDADGLFQVLI
jgi:hypothetical protein